MIFIYKSTIQVMVVLTPLVFLTVSHRYLHMKRYWTTPWHAFDGTLALMGLAGMITKLTGAHSTTGTAGANIYSREMVVGVDVFHFIFGSECMCDNANR